MSISDMNIISAFGCDKLDHQCVVQVQSEAPRPVDLTPAASASVFIFLIVAVAFVLVTVTRRYWEWHETCARAIGDAIAKGGDPLETGAAIYNSGSGSITYSGTGLRKHPVQE